MTPIGKARQIYNVEWDKASELTWLFSPACIAQKVAEL
jgi:hypothetical protein